MRKLQWSHGRLTVVTPIISKYQMKLGLLQWSHGRLTVVTERRYLDHHLPIGFNGATVV